MTFAFLLTLALANTLRVDGQVVCETTQPIVYENRTVRVDCDSLFRASFED